MRSAASFLSYSIGPKLAFGGLEKNDLPLKSPRNKIIQILFQQCEYIHDLLIWAKKLI